MDLQNILSLALSSTSLNQKLLLARLYAALVTGHPAGIYDAISFERKLLQDFTPLISELCLAHGEIENEILHIVSEPYTTGGHTRLCEKLALMNSEGANLLITKSADIQVIKRLRRFFKSIDYALNNDELLRIKEIFHYVIKYKKVVLHLHPDDIVTVIAVGLAKTKLKELKVYFVNHADHLFSFGKSITDVMLQISYRGYEVDNLVLDKPYVNSFLGIPVHVNAKPIMKPLIRDIVIAGASFKMKPTAKLSIQKELFKFLSENRLVTLKVIGCNYSDFWWWKLKLYYPKRVTLYNSLPYEKYLEVIKSCDTCIDTAPVTGGTAFVEMFLNNLRPIGLLSGIYGYTPLDKLRLKGLKDIDIYKSSISDEVWDDISRVHDIKSVKKRYLDALKGKYHPVDQSLTTLNNDMQLFHSGSKVRLSYSNYIDIKNLTFLSNLDKMKMVFKNFNIFGAMFRVVGKKIKKLKRYI